MLEISSTAVETQLHIDFAEVYANSDLYRYVHNIQHHTLLNLLSIECDVNFLIIHYNFQEKSGPHQGAKYSTTRFQGSLLPNTLLTKFHNSVQGMFLETTLVLLEEFAIQCYPVFHDNCYWYIIWCNLLGKRRPDVRMFMFLRVATSLYVHFHVPAHSCTT